MDEDFGDFDDEPDDDMLEDEPKEEKLSPVQWPTGSQKLPHQKRIRPTGSGLSSERAKMAMVARNLRGEVKFRCLLCHGK